MPKLLNKYLSPFELNNLKSLENLISNKIINVTCMGLYNHGKSSLLNALIKDFEDATFKTADIRKTVTAKRFEFNGINYIDTPGLNAKENDDKRVFDAVKESDINLFVHTITAGEFVKKEIDFLIKIKNNWSDPQEFINRTIFVLSRVDKANSNEDITNTIYKMKLQIKEIFNSEAAFIPVSSLRYKNGKNEDKSILIKRSNIEVLEDAIKEFRDKHFENILKTRILRLNNIYDELIKKFESRRQEKMLELSKQKQVKNKFLNKIKMIEKNLEKIYLRLEE